jgi:hypothetical protein
VVTQYNHQLTAFMASHHLLQSLHQLYLACMGDFTPVQDQQLQGLDTLPSQGMQYAKKKCRKCAISKVEYSPLWQPPAYDDGYGKRLCTANRVRK